MEDRIVLLQAVRNMDADALAKVFDLYSSAVYRYALRHCGNSVIADQIVGDVFSDLLEHLFQGNGPRSNLRSYLFEMAYHAIVDEARSAYRITSIDTVEFILPAENDTDFTADTQMLLTAVWQAIKSSLTEDQRHVIILRFLEDFSLKETALIMGKKVGTIKAIQNRAVGALRKALDNQAIEYPFIVRNRLVPHPWHSIDRP